MNLRTANFSCSFLSGYAAIVERICFLIFVFEFASLRLCPLLNRLMQPAGSPLLGASMLHRFDRLLLILMRFHHRLNQF